MSNEIELVEIEWPDYLKNSSGYKEIPYAFDVEGLPSWLSARVNCNHGISYWWVDFQANEVPFFYKLKHRTSLDFAKETVPTVDDVKHAIRLLKAQVSEVISWFDKEVS